MKILNNTDILTVPFGKVIHFVNCKGVWGAGLAAQMKQVHPEAFEKYKKDLAKEKHPVFALGSISQCETKDGNKTIISCFTQYDTGVTSRKTEYSAVRSCFLTLSKTYGFGANVYIPYEAGCGLGGGDWEIVSKIIERYLPDAILCKK
jgi:hypothetical protein